jgi:AraC family transcriptional regulator of adaptative response / DNA-3-methyladenine glycosylase II
MQSTNQLTEALCYQAVQSRDVRFDGRFFTAVLTTGVYCRPICPAVTPLRRNVRFYPCAAAAEEAGFRPCRRCRPDAAPGTPAWRGTSATVLRGLRCIAEGALDAGSVQDLADRLGMGDRQLRRLFREHLGAPPHALARTRRAHFARQLIDQTALPMTEVAFAAGFGSLRQFNDVMRSTFGRAPAEMRRGVAQPSGTPDGLRLHVPVRAPYDWSSLLAFLTRRAIPGVEQVTPAAYRRSILVDGAPHRIEVTFEPQASRLVLRVQSPATRGLLEVVERVSGLFDALADPLPIGEHLRRDAELRPLLRARPGLRVPGAWDGFELGVRAILGQQVSVAGASTLAGRLVQRFGARLPEKTVEMEEIDETKEVGEIVKVEEVGGITHLFPTAARLAEADLTKVGLPGSRAKALRSFAREVAAGNLSLSPAASMEETRARLLAIAGLGPWTVEYIALRALRDPDAFPAGDLGLRHALSPGPTLISEKALRARAEIWRPWRAYAAVHLWTALPPSSPSRTAPSTAAPSPNPASPDAPRRNHARSA